MKPNTQQFLTQVAVFDTGESKEKITSVLQAMDNNNHDEMAAFSPSFIVWIELIMEIIQEVMEKCEERNNNKIAARIASPGLFNRIKFKRLVRQKCRDCEADMCDADALAVNFERAVKEVGPEVILGTVEEIQKRDYWLI